MGKAITACIRGKEDALPSFEGSWSEHLCAGLFAHTCVPGRRTASGTGCSAAPTRDRPANLSSFLAAADLARTATIEKLYQAGDDLAREQEMVNQAR